VHNMISSQQISGAAKGRQVSKHVRSGVQFPSHRPDGHLPPVSDKGYKPAIRLGASTERSGQAFVGCNEDGCPGMGGGDVGTQPDASSSYNGVNAYGWNSQNYSEIWDASSGLLNAQIYWSVAGTVVTCQMLTPDGNEATISIDQAAISSEGTTYLSDGTRVTVSAGGGTYDVLMTDGTEMSGNIDSSGREAMSVTRTVPGRYPGGSVAGTMQLLGVIFPGNMAHCLGVALVMLTVVLLALALAIAVLIATCAGTAGVLCAVAALLAAAMVAEALVMYHNVVTEACGS
jgi:hypothetical protein